jgi:predicted dehydrogenase
MIAARSMVEQGLLGDLTDVEARIQLYTPWSTWPFLLGLPRLELLYHSIHYIDLLRSFLGNTDSVYAKTLIFPLTPELAPTRSMVILDYGDRVRANIMTNHGHIYGRAKQQSYIKFEGIKGAVEARMGVNMDYPKGVPDLLEYVLLEEEKEPEWKTLDIQGSWFPEAFIGTMASLMRYVQGESKTLPTSVEDAIYTMATVEAAYISSEAGGTPLPAI